MNDQMNDLNAPHALELCPLVEAALREDMRSGDITTNALIPRHAQARANMVFREPGIVSGVLVARHAFQLLSEDIRAEIVCQPGTRVKAGEVIMQVTGDARALLTAERVALNFTQRMSGIATLTRRFVEAIAGTGAQIVDTRKTTPGLRILEKYAVRCGGGSNHRFALDDLVLIKDNHIALCGGIAPAVRRARQHIGHAVKIEIECDTLDQVREAAASKVDIILLDNMKPHDLRAAVQIIEGRALTEASGGITLASVRAIAESGVNLISVGALTHSARALDIGLDIEIEGAS